MGATTEGSCEPGETGYVDLVVKPGAPFHPRVLIFSDVVWEAFDLLAVTIAGVPAWLKPSEGGGAIFFKRRAVKPGETIRIYFGANKPARFIVAVSE